MMQVQAHETPTILIVLFPFINFKGSFSYRVIYFNYLEMGFKDVFSVFLVGNRASEPTIFICDD